MVFFRAGESDFAFFEEIESAGFGVEGKEVTIIAAIRFVEAEIKTILLLFFKVYLFE